ncbi:MAG: YDG domain-containing protein [Kiritimatiellia bacterium]|nr:YDG domain-containing protein [Kiritimatiellia bacterium]
MAHRADTARTTYSVDGSGVSVGVLSDSVESLAALQGTGDLPAGVTVLSGQAGSGSSEGTAMLEIVYDVAPGASLYFATAFSGQAQFAQNILDLQTAGCDVIVDDVGYFAEYVFQDGIIAQAVETVVAAGATYFSSAGNSGNLNDGQSGVWEGDFAAAGSRPTPITYGTAHDFGGGVNYNTITVDSSSYFTLQWSDPGGGSGNDYDLFLLNGTRTSLYDYSNATQNGDDDPYEIIDSTTFNDAGNTLVIIRYSGSSRYLHLNANRGRLAISTDGQTAGHSAAAAFSVAAVNVATAGGGAFVGGGTNPVETFSSDGPRRVFYAANGTPITPGNYLATGGEVRQKPDIAAADGVSCATPGFNPFFGTSAAAPHAAGIAALMFENGLTTPALIRQAISNTTWDIEAVGIDRDSGYGLMDALGAVGYDIVPPTVTINQAGGQVDPTNGAPISFTVLFSESVSDFATGDVTITGTASGSKTATVTGSGTTYNVAVSGMTGGGTVIAAIAAGKAHDATGNANTASTSTDNTVTYDVTSPTISSITSTSDNGTYGEGEAINVTLNFSEDVTLVGGDLVITLETGDTDREVTISTISSSDTAAGNYTVQAGDASADLSVKSIGLSGTTLRDAAGNDADLDIPSGQNLDDNKNFAVQTSHTITAGKTGDGSISPEGDVTVTHNGTTNFLMTANAAKHIASIKTNDSHIAGSPYSGNALTSTNYVWSSIVADGTVTVAFAVNSYQIDASAGANGSITPSGAIPVEHGGSTNFTVTADEGYYIWSIKEDGANVAAFEQGDTNYIHALTNVTNSHTVVAEFETNSVARHWSDGYYLPGTNTIYCDFTYPTNRDLISLKWETFLSSGWTLNTTSGDGSPELTNGNEIIFAGLLTNNPVEFTYTVVAPGGETGGREISADVEYQLSGAINPSTTDAIPDPLPLRRLLTLPDLTATNKTYDGGTGATISVYGSLSTVAGGDVVTLDTSGAVASFNDASVGTGKVVTVTGLALTGADAGDYAIQDQTTTADITAKGLAVTGATADNKVYDATDDATITGGSLAGVEAGDTVTLGNAATGTFAQVTIETNIAVTSYMTLGGADAGNYTLSQPTLAADITAKGLTVTGATADDKVYDATDDATITGGALAGVEAGDTVTLGNTVTGTFAQVTIGTEIAVTSYMTLGGADAGNYSLSQPTLAADITAKSLTVTGATADDKVYDATDDATITGGALSGVEAGDTVTLGNAATGTFAQVTIGTEIAVTSYMTLGGSDAGNYTLSQPVLDADITAKGLTVTGATADDKVYDATDDATITGGALAGVEAGDTVTLGNAATGTFAQVTIGTDIAVTSYMTLGGADAGNYTLSQPTLAADITAKGLTVTGATADDKVYDATDDATITGGALSGVEAGDTVTLANAATGTFAQVTIGTNIAVTSYMTLGGADAGNYTLSQPTLAADITAKGLTVTGATAADKVYDATDDATITGGALAGVEAGDTVTLGNAATGTFAQVTIGTDIAVTSYMTLGGADAGNYTLSQPALDADITAKGLTVTGATADDKVYDATDDATITGGALAGVEAGDTVTLGNAATGTFAQVTIGTEIAVTSYMTLGGADAGNYTLSQPTLAADITAKGLTATGATADDKIYDATDDATLAGGALDGVEAGDTVTLENAATGTFAQVTIGSDIAVTSYMTLGGADAGNYSLSQPAGLSADITALELTVGGTFTALDKVYDGTTAATIDTNALTLLTPEGGDDVSMVAAAAFSDAAVGAGKTVSLTGSTLDGGDAGNYMLSLAGAPTTTAAITFPEVTATHTCNGYGSPSTNMLVTNVFSHSSGQTLLELTWKPLLPGTWTLTEASGDGGPSVVGTNVVFAGPFTTNRIEFTYTLNVPGGADITNAIRGIVQFRFAGMADSLSSSASPDPLIVARYHSADYRAPYWVMDGTEVNRILVYWREGNYHIEPFGYDGYAPGVGDTSGYGHNADYQSDYWKIDETEAQEALTYWRAGAYEFSDTSTDDGYAPNWAGGKKGDLTAADADEDETLVLTQGSADYDPGGLVAVTNTLEFTGQLLSLSSRPQLPPGWELVSVTGDGNPEARRGGILWTTKQPQSPILMVYTVRAPLWELGTRDISTQVRYYFSGAPTAGTASSTEGALVVSPRDTDADGIPDGWEEHYTGSSTGMSASGDEDGDGAINLHECIAGTDPLDKESHLVVSALRADIGDRVILQWQSATNRLYSIGESTNLLNTFRPVVTNIPATPPVNVHEVDTEGLQTLFYSIGVEQ